MANLSKYGFIYPDTQTGLIAGTHLLGQNA